MVDSLTSLLYVFHPLYQFKYSYTLNTTVILIHQCLYPVLLRQCIGSRALKHFIVMHHLFCYFDSV